MKKVKYFYNTNTLRYEKLVTPLRVKLLRVFSFLASVAVAGFLFMQISYRYFPSANEKKLINENNRIKDSYSILSEEIKRMNQELREIEKRDNQVYRSIFEASPLPDSARAKMMEKQAEDRMIARLSEDELNTSILQQINTLRNRIYAQNTSFTAIEGMVKNKEALLAATPAIQPVSNKELSRLASGFGYRIDPVYKTTKFHAGLDFAAPQGTPIYATADGVVKVAGNLGNGFGNHVVINHGYGYETLYAHLSKYKARRGQRVKRGDIIGYVGSTGRSEAPHLHYEVHQNNRVVNPLNFYYGNISAVEYVAISKLANQENQSLD